MLCVKMYAVCRSQMFVNMRCRIVMDSGTARTSESIVMGSENARASDSRADQGVLRMDEEGVSAEEQARRRLRSKQPDIDGQMMKQFRSE